MLASIIASGLAIGAVYALIGIVYNTMYSASRVMSFTAGQVGMLGGVFGSLFILRMGMPPIVGFLLTLAGLRRDRAWRPRSSRCGRCWPSWSSISTCLSTLALTLMIQQVTAIEWSTEPQPFPRLFGIGNGGPFDEKFWLPLLACGVVIAGLEFLYRRTLVGHAFLAIAEDNFAARALGLPERNLRMASFAMAGHDRRHRRVLLGRVVAGVLRQRRDAELLRLRADRARRAGQ